MKARELRGVGVLLGLVLLSLLACKSGDKAPAGMTKVSCTKQVKGEMFVPAEQQACGSDSTHDCFKASGWIVTVTAEEGTASSKEEAANLAKGSSRVTHPMPSAVEELGKGDYLVPVAVAHGSSDLLGYIRVLPGAKVKCSATGKNPTELMSKLKSACTSFKPGA